MSIPIWVLQGVWTVAYVIAAVVSVRNTWDGWLSLSSAKAGDEELGGKVDEISVLTARLFFVIQATLGAFATGMAIAGGLSVFTEGAGQLILLILTLGAPVVGGLTLWITRERKKIFELLRTQLKPKAPDKWEVKE